jgi:hypothetical protein
MAGLAPAFPEDPRACGADSTTVTHSRSTAGTPPRVRGGRKYADRARRHHALVHELLAQRRGLREIARHLGCGLHTVQR